MKNLKFRDEEEREFFEFYLNRIRTGKSKLKSNISVDDLSDFEIFLIYKTKGLMECYINFVRAKTKNAEFFRGAALGLNDLMYYLGLGNEVADLVDELNAIDEENEE